MSHQLLRIWVKMVSSPKMAPSLATKLGTLKIIYFRTFLIENFGDAIYQFSSIFWIPQPIHSDVVNEHIVVVFVWRRIRKGIPQSSDSDECEHQRLITKPVSEGSTTKSSDNKNSRRRIGPQHLWFYYCQCRDSKKNGANKPPHTHTNAMTVVEGSKILKDFADFVESNPKCSKQFTAVSKKKHIDLEDIGSRPNNLMLEFLKCHTKVVQKTNQDTACKGLEKSYLSCHASVMGTGNFNGQKHCGEQLKEWLECCSSSAAGS